MNPLNWWRYFLSQRWYLAWCAIINHLVLTLPRRLLHMLHWRSRIILYLISTTTLNLLRWALNCLDIIITSRCCFLMSSTGLISPVSRRMWNICNTLKFVFLRIESNSSNYVFLCTFKLRENNFFIKLKFIIGCSNIVVHTCWSIWFNVISGFDLKFKMIQIAFKIVLK